MQTTLALLINLEKIAQDNATGLLADPDPTLNNVDRQILTSIVLSKHLS